MRRKLLLIGVLAVLLLLSVCIHTASAENILVRLKVKCDNNWFYSRYDYDIYVENLFLGTWTHGADPSLLFQASTEGKYNFRFYKHEDHSISGSFSVDIDSPSCVSCQIHCYNNNITVSNTKIEKAVFPSADKDTIRPGDLQKIYLKTDDSPQQLIAGLGAATGGVMLMLPEGHSEMVLTLHWINGGYVDLLILDKNDRITRDTYWGLDWASYVPELAANTFPDETTCKILCDKPTHDDGINQYSTRNTYLLSEDTKAVIVYCSEKDNVVTKRENKEDVNSGGSINVGVNGTGNATFGGGLNFGRGSSNSTETSQDYYEALFEIVSLENR